jgi:tryptophan-rich sensory protein
MSSKDVSTDELKKKAYEQLNMKTLICLVVVSGVACLLVQEVDNIWFHELQKPYIPRTVPFAIYMVISWGGPLVILFFYFRKRLEITKKFSA